MTEIFLCHFCLNSNAIILDTKQTILYNKGTVKEFEVANYAKIFLFAHCYINAPDRTYSDGVGGW